MEKTIKWEELFYSFGILWELLPFFGSYRSWRYLMCMLNKQTKIIWEKNWNAFKQLSKGAQMGVIKHDNELTEQFLEYISDPDILMHYKIAFDLWTTKPTTETFSKFREFIGKFKNSSNTLHFHSIKLSFDYAGKEIFEMISEVFNMSEINKHDVLKFWRITSSKFSYGKINVSKYPWIPINIFNLIDSRKPNKNQTTIDYLENELNNGKILSYIYLINLML